MADKDATRAYRNEYNRHRDAARRYLQDVAETSARLLERWDTTTPVIAAGEAERIAKDAASAWHRAAQYEALHEVRFLTTDPEAGEQ